MITHDTVVLGTSLSDQIGLEEAIRQVHLIFIQCEPGEVRVRRDDQQISFHVSNERPKISRRQIFVDAHDDSGDFAVLMWVVNNALASMTTTSDALRLSRT